MDGTIIIENSLDDFIEMNLNIRPDLLRRDFSVGTCRVPARPWRVWTFHAVDIPASTWPPRRTLPLPASVHGTKIKIHLNKVEIKRRNFTWKRWDRGRFSGKCIFKWNGMQMSFVPAWAVGPRWRRIPGSIRPLGRAASRPSWRWRGFPGPGRPSLWRNRAPGTCARCRAGSPSRRPTWLLCTRRTAAWPVNRWRNYT